METLANSIAPITKYSVGAKKKKDKKEFDQAMKLLGLFDESEERKDG